MNESSMFDLIPYSQFALVDVPVTLTSLNCLITRYSTLSQNVK